MQDQLQEKQRVINTMEESMQVLLYWLLVVLSLICLGLVVVADGSSEEGWTKGVLYCLLLCVS